MYWYGKRITKKYTSYIYIVISLMPASWLCQAKTLLAEGHVHGWCLPHGWWNTWIIKTILPIVHLLGIRWDILYYQMSMHDIFSTLIRSFNWWIDGDKIETCSYACFLFCQRCARGTINTSSSIIRSSIPLCQSPRRQFVTHGFASEVV